MDRKQFVVSASASALAALTWMRGPGRLDSLSLGAPLESRAQDVALAITRAILPFEHPRFPKITPADIRIRMYALFSLDEDSSFASTLALFNALGAWSNPPKTVLEVESTLYGPPDVAHDRKLFETWNGGATTETATFTDLNLVRQRSYLTMWARSAFGVRRRTYQSFKALANATAYSMEALWSAIGYDGPLVARQTVP
jgi:hypothetical protein